MRSLNPAPIPGAFKPVHSLFMWTTALAAFFSHQAVAEDFGAYSLVPVSAPALVLEVPGPPEPGTSICLGKPGGGAHQKWIIIPRGDSFYSIKPSTNTALVLAVSKGGTNNGATIVLEADKGEPWQEWAIKKNENGTYSIFPRHSPDKGLDDFGGNKAEGAKVDLWIHKPGDSHLQWQIKPLAGTAVPLTEAPQTTYTPPEPPPEKLLPGIIKKTAFTTSTIFPGTIREVTVFVPAQYDASKPACVYVKTDGYNPKEKGLLETLIATGEMPVTVGIFVTPGMLPPAMPGTLGRRNRCFEYDGVGDYTVRFLVEELLPFVAREFDLNLSLSGNDRCIAGGSSGGIAAFNAAWERPEAFSRVYCNSGSFVAFRGGHEFPTLVRKFEAKPIRAYLTTGTHDMENCAGDWFLLDQEMDKALKFSGYDYFFRSINGGHVAGYYDYFREAMSYLWKGWPKPVQAGSSAPRVQDVLVPEEPWQLAAQGLQEARGAACSPNGEVFFVEAQANKISRIDLEGKVRAFLPDAGHANGLSFGAEGQLYAVSEQTGQVMRYEADGKATLVTTNLYGRHIQAVPNGGLYVSGGSKKEEGSVWFVREGQTTLVDSGLKRATGIALRPDQWLLSVAEGQSKWAYSYQANPDGSLSHKERFFWLHVPDWEDDAGAQGLCYAREGQMLVATRLGVQVCTDDGPTQAILPLPDHSRVDSVCLGGPDMDTLFAFSGDKIWKRKVKIHASGAFSPWTKVTGGKL